MKKTGVIIATAITLFIGMGCLVGGKAYAAPQQKQVDILFTHDIHSYLENHQVMEADRIIEVGGMPRLSTLVNEKRSQNPDTLLLDAGDYPMGTLFQTLYSSDALEYRILSKLKFDATTFGNHDFDYGTEGLVSQYEACAEKCDYFPQFLSCNIDWSVDDEATKLIHDALDDLNLKEYAVFERGGLKIGVTGVLGYDAIKCAPTMELTTLDPIESVRATVNKMIENDNPDMIVVISHSGVNTDNIDASEDVKLAEAVPEIDFIVAGHSHNELPEVLKVGDTYIGACGCYGRNTGFISLKQNDNGRFDVVDYQLISMDESIKEDPEIVEMLDEFKALIDDNYLDNYGYSADQVLAENDITFSTVDDVYDIHTEHDLGNFLSDSYRWAMGQYNTGDDTPITAAVAPAGTIRGSYLPGNIDVADVYESFSLGSGTDGTVGYPIIDVYMTGAELKTLCELDASVSDLMNAARLYLSGIEYTFNPHRMILNRVTEVHLNTGLLDDDTDVIIDDSKLYRVVTDLYSGRMLGNVSGLSYGLLSIVPKDKNGIPFEKIEDAIAHDIDTGEEIKTWVCIAKYMQSYDDDNDKIGEIPQYYVNNHNRKIVNDSWNIAELLKSPNKFFFMIIGVVILILVIVFFIIKLIIWIIKKIISRINKHEIEEGDTK